MRIFFGHKNFKKRRTPLFFLNVDSRQDFSTDQSVPFWDIQNGTSKCPLFLQWYILLKNYSRYNHKLKWYLKVIEKGTFFHKKVHFIIIPFTERGHFFRIKSTKKGIKIDAFLYKVMYFGQKRYLFPPFSLKNVPFEVLS